MRVDPSLPPLAIHIEPERQVLRVGDFVGGDEPGSERTEGRAALALGPGAAALELIFALREIVADAIAGDELQGFVRAHIRCAVADDDGELDFPIGFQRTARNDHVVVGPDDAGRRLVEHDRLCRDGGAGLSGVIGIIQADGDEVSHIPDACAEALAGRHQRQRCGIDGLETREALGAERIARNVGDKPREVADVAVRIQQPWLLAPERTESHQFHFVLLTQGEGVIAITATVGNALLRVEDVAVLSRMPAKYLFGDMPAASRDPANYQRLRSFTCERPRFICRFKTTT